MNALVWLKGRMRKRRRPGILPHLCAQSHTRTYSSLDTLLSRSHRSLSLSLSQTPFYLFITTPAQCQHLLWLVFSVCKYLAIFCDSATLLSLATNLSLALYFSFSLSRTCSLFLFSYFVDIYLFSRVYYLLYVSFFKYKDDTSLYLSFSFSPFLNISCISSKLSHFHWHSLSLPLSLALSLALSLVLSLALSLFKQHHWYSLSLLFLGRFLNDHDLTFLTVMSSAAFFQLSGFSFFSGCQTQLKRWRKVLPFVSRTSGPI